ncbi:hypothetical protein DICSQDRAFT_152415 [Dichomitus squalens LYAD-421 SS1]|uniref:uncharacterized protein n=1 Tax=Dichomitus squalens (strain LYAD-421) TaxID=732165 RepID=UPI000441170B|nr:uncharacterized protein DICSQDRAFT_152415 [Dichomitus squalens LYAD-421 SS1]EJF65138.1 hypothetical protein DICSQDRAFT_152415 [Dichomitus squalens LYAD-421 SS1]
MTVESAAGEIVLHPPNAHNPPIELDLEKFMGKWYVIHSTLPLWKSRKDVTITYALKTSPSEETVKFDDIVEYRSKSDPPTSSRSRVVGIDTLISSPDTNAPPASSAARSGPLGGSDAPSTGSAPADAAVATSNKSAQTRYKWRGKGWLVIASSRWQLLGCSADPSPENAAAWAVTYFEKTLFTPAGLDIYSRTAAGLPADVVAEIVEKAKGLGGDVAKLAEGFFEVERSGVDGKGTI